MIRTEKVKTWDGFELKTGDPVWYIKDNKVKQVMLHVGYHDKLFKIFKFKGSADKLLENFNKKRI